MAIRRKFQPVFKAKAALEAQRGGRTIQKIRLPKPVEMLSVGFPIHHLDCPL